LKRLIALFAIAIAALTIAVAWNPYLLVRAEFARERIVAGLSQRSVEAAGFRWVYATRDADAANATTIVMIHGFTGSKENWYPLARELEGRYRIVMPDLPGWGASEHKPGADYGFVAQAERVAAFIRVVSPNRPVVLLGHSMGGGIAARTRRSNNRCWTGSGAAPNASCPATRPRASASRRCCCGAGRTR
jgi:predicted alpha/beta-fold hydrolase